MSLKNPPVSFSEIDSSGSFGIGWLTITTSCIDTAWLDFERRYIIDRASGKDFTYTERMTSRDDMNRRNAWIRKSYDHRHIVNCFYWNSEWTLGMYLLWLFETEDVVSVLCELRSGGYQQWVSPMRKGCSKIRLP